jgi:hypothetical protein
MKKKTTPPRYCVHYDNAVPRFPWTVVDADGMPALWGPDQRVGKLPRRFRTEALAQAAADKLNAQ